MQEVLDLAFGGPTVLERSATSPDPRSPGGWEFGSKTTPSPRMGCLAPREVARSDSDLYPRTGFLTVKRDVKHATSGVPIVEDPRGALPWSLSVLSPVISNRRPYWMIIEFKVHWLPLVPTLREADAGQFRGCG